MPDENPSTAPTIDTNGSSRPTGGQVMDIQSPKPTPTSQSDQVMAPAITNVEVVESDDVIAEPPTVDEPVTESQEPTPETATGATSSTDTVVATTQDADSSEPITSPTTGTNEANPLAIPPTVPKKSGGKSMLVIIIAVVVALVLAGLVVFVFLKPKKDTGSNKTSANSTSNQTAPKPLASPADVDSTNKEIDSSLSKVSDATDFSSTDLSDKSLGL